MKLLGLDLGTTTVSAVVMEDGAVLKALTLPGAPFLSAAHRWEKLQDPEVFRARAFEAVDSLLREFSDVGRIGVTGQMHGILYLDRTGKPLSPLYTWQDGRGDLPMPEGTSYASYLAERTGMPASTGYGLVTHFYNVRNDLVPQGAAVLCTVHDYIAMLLAGLSRPVTDSTDAASLGLFDAERGCFPAQALEAAGLDSCILAELTGSREIGYYKNKIPVSAAIGDNQASFLGTTGGIRDAMLVNFGTGSQFSAFSPLCLQCPGLETRPFPGGGYLLVGASLCGGRAYALLESFFRETARAMTGTSPEQCYSAMDAMLSRMEPPRDLPEFVPLFQGTRLEPDRRGELRGLSALNFTPLHMTWGLLYGMTDELHELCLSYLSHGGRPAPLYGSGNGLRKNRWLQQCVTERFGQPLTLSGRQEEAACGAAMFAAGLA